MSGIFQTGEIGRQTDRQTDRQVSVTKVCKFPRKKQGATHGVYWVLPLIFHSKQEEICFLPKPFCSTLKIERLIENEAKVEDFEGLGVFWQLSTGNSNQVSWVRFLVTAGFSLFSFITIYSVMGSVMGQPNTRLAVGIVNLHNMYDGDASTAAHSTILHLPSVANGYGRRKHAHTQVSLYLPTTPVLEFEVDKQLGCEPNQKVLPMKYAIYGNICFL